MISKTIISNRRELHRFISSSNNYYVLSRPTFMCIKKYSSISSTNELSLNPENAEEQLTNENEVDEIEKKRNKSGLNDKHYRLMHEQPPILSEDEKYIMTLRKYRRQFGTYGEASQINAAALWPSKIEMMLSKEREALEYPNTIQEMIEIARKEKEEKEEEERLIQQNIINNMKDLKKWIKKVRDKMDRKEMEAKISKEKREKQIEEVRQMFGFYIPPSDEKFQEAIKEKEIEEKKRLKKEKKLLKQQMLLEKLTAEAEEQVEKAEREKMHGESIIEGQTLPDIKK